MSTRPQLTIGEVARRLGVSVSTVRRYEAAGLIAARRTPGGQRRFDAADVEALSKDTATTHPSQVAVRLPSHGQSLG